MYYVRVVAPESGASEIVPVDYATRLYSELSEAIRVFDAFNGTETRIRRSTWQQVDDPFYKSLGLRLTTIRNFR